MYSEVNKSSQKELAICINFQTKSASEPEVDLLESLDQLIRGDHIFFQLKNIDKKRNLRESSYVLLLNANKNEGEFVSRSREKGI